MARLELLNDTDLQIDFQSIIGRRYSVMESNNLSGWSELTNLRADGSMMSLIDAGVLSEPRKFYQVEVNNSQWIDPATPVE
jgi:hypothetical protein